MSKDLRNTRLSKLATTAFVLGSGLALQGCVAAAFPIAAGGLLGERTISRGNSDAQQPEPVVQVATSDGTSEVVNSDLVPVNEVPANAVPPAASTSADFNAAFADNAAVGAQPTQTPTVVVSAAPDTSDQSPAPVNRPTNRVVRPLPTPVPSAREPLTAPISGPGAGPTASPITGPIAAPVSAPAAAPLTTPADAPAFTSNSPLSSLSGVNQFLSYANQRKIGAGDEPEAAMLSNRVTLEPVKAQCGGVSPTVLIDLDPEGGLFDSTTASRPPSGLARGLAQLRESGVNIAWISGNGIDKLDAIKRALTYSGLDLANEDRVLLVRGPDDRKQTLREELSQISCLVAIAGDTRSDFDELYDYLKNPSDANSLEPLIGDGWFLIPQPLL